MSKVKKVLGGLMGAAPKVDTAALQRQEQLLKEQEARIAEQEEERKKKDAAATRARSGRVGRESLLSGLETGVDPITTGKRTSLG